MNPVKVDALALWAPYFINGDATGLTTEEANQADQWRKAECGGALIVDCGEDTFYGRFQGVQAMLVEYTYLVESDEHECDCVERKPGMPCHCFA